MKITSFANRFLWALFRLQTYAHQFIVYAVRTLPQPSTSRCSFPFAHLPPAAFSCLVWFVYAYGQPGLGQVCLDVTNEPAVNQSFGQARTQVSLSGRTTYQYSADPCPENGFYTVSDAVDGRCFSNAWHGVTEDHTSNDERGNMMIVNGSEESGEFYQHPLTGLCSGTPYEFSVWGMNLLKPGFCSAPVLPDLTISIETVSGQVIQSINIGILPQSETPTWRRLSTVFTAPESTEGVVVKLINLSGAGGCGNDLVLDDIQLKQCAACAPTPLYVPDAFSPNNDGVNDELAVFLRRADTFSVTIYNRWGRPVFTSNNLTQRWDGNSGGSPSPAGDYTWVVNYGITDDTNVTRDYTRTGRVLLLR